MCKETSQLWAGPFPGRGILGYMNGERRLGTSPHFFPFVYCRSDVGSFFPPHQDGLCPLWNCEPGRALSPLSRVYEGDKDSFQTFSRVFCYVAKARQN